MTAALQQYVGNCRVRAVRRYSMVEMTGLFFAFSLIGWLWEVGLHVVLDGEPVNRGTMLGPWLPIYGAGGVLAVLLLRRVAYSPALVLALGTGMCTAVEYATGRYLLAVYGLRWWDYSMYPLNVDGLVSPLTSLLFGLGCCAAVYWAGPALAARVRRLNQRQARMLLAVLLVLFALDFVWSTVHPNAGAGVAAPMGGMTVVEPNEIGLLAHNLP